MNVSKPGRSSLHVIYQISEHQPGLYSVKRLLGRPLALIQKIEGGYPPCATLGGGSIVTEEVESRRKVLVPEEGARGGETEYECCRAKVNLLASVQLRVELVYHGEHRGSVQSVHDVGACVFEEVVI